MAARPEAPQGGLPQPHETILTDLPNDLLTHILAFLPTADRFRAATACRDLAAAVRPPSAAWTEMSLTAANVCDPVKFGSLIGSLCRAATSVRRLDVEAADAVSVHSLISVVHAAAPFLESLALRGDLGDRLPSLVAGVRQFWASTTRLTHLVLGPIAQFYAPPGGLTNAAKAAAATPEMYLRPLPSLGSVMRVAQVAMHVHAHGSRRGFVLARLRGVGFYDSADVPPGAGLPHPIELGMESINAFAAVAGRSLTHLSIVVRHNDEARLPLLVNRLTSLQEFVVNFGSFIPGVVDLSSITARFLTRLAVVAWPVVTVRMSNAQAGRLRDLSLAIMLNAGPPDFIRGDRFSSLTRLKYAHTVPGSPANLGLWSDTGLAYVPALVELMVQASSFTLDGRGGQVWADAVAGMSLPRLSVLAAFCFYPVVGQVPAVQYACRAVPGGRPGWPGTHCPYCGSEGECDGGRAARHAITTSLPAAYARRGRALQVGGVLQDHAWHTGDERVEMRFEAAPPPG